MRKNIAPVLAVIAVSALVLVGCNAQTSTTTDTTNAGSSSSSTSTSTGTGTSASDITIQVSSYAFTPNEITIAPGATVNINLVVKDSIHTFNIDALGVSTGEMTAGETKVVTVTVPASAIVGSTYQFYCAMPGHQGFGMVGTIKVGV